MTKTSPRRIPRRRGDSSRQAAFTFLSNISLDNNDQQGELNSSSNIPINDKHDKASSFPDNKKPDLHIDTKKAFSTIEKVSNNEATTRSHVTSKTRISPNKKIFNNDKTSPIVLKEGHLDNLNSSSDVRLRSNSLREEAAINFLTNINLDSNRNQHPSRESLTSSTTISVFEASDDNLLNEVDENVGNQENLEGSSSSPSSAYVRRRRSSTSTLNSDTSSSSSISCTLSNSPNHPTATTSLSITRNKLEQHRPNKQADNVINTNPISNSTSIGDQNNNRKQQQSGVGSFLTTSAPLGIFSMLGYSDKKSKHQRNHKENLKKISTDLEFTKSRKVTSNYDPRSLDDPELKTERQPSSNEFQEAKPNKHRSMLKANERFRQLHPEIDPSLTLSQIRKVKAKLLAATTYESLDLELSTIAKSYAYFEKLILKSLHKNLEVTKKEILEQEFSVFSSLEFELYLHNQEYMPHFERLLTNLNIKNKQEYLGDNPFYEINYSKRNNDIDL
ncbi:6317_t:CDS:10 [Entrophospora sp. SA101]|nr:6317_t:CDS:10 [Entrophospora sp. SA101]